MSFLTTRPEKTTVAVCVAFETHSDPVFTDALLNSWNDGKKKKKKRKRILLWL
jgi:hypothetical protein